MYYFKTYFVDIFKYKYAIFGGRARREEYWYFTLFWLIFAVMFGLFGILGEEYEIDILSSIGFGALAIYTVGSILPYLAVVSRRLHDTGRSGLWWLIRFIPFGAIVLLVFYCLDSEKGPNKWGHSPKYYHSDDGEIQVYDKHLIDEDLI